MENINVTNQKPMGDREEAWTKVTKKRMAKKSVEHKKNRGPMKSSLRIWGKYRMQISCAASKPTPNWMK